jgi:predicted nucleic-acid-binding protein
MKESAHICERSMRAVDTNVLVRVIVRDDDAQVDAAEAFILNGAWVSQVVLAEAAWVLTSNHGFSRA